METGTQECKLHDCTLASVLPVGIFHTDVKGHYLWVNEYWCEIAGITAVESEGNAWVQVLYPDDKERVFANWYRTVQENLPFRLEYRIQRLDGKITWVLGQAVAKKDKTGTVIGYVGTLTDITDYKQTEEKLSKDRYYLKELVQERSTELQQVNEQLQQEIAQRQRVEETQARLIAVLEATTNSVGAELGEISARVSADQNITKVKQAEEELALRNRELLTLHKISEIHLSTESLKATLQEIVEEISTATGFPIIAIEFYDEVRQMMVFEAIKGIPLPPNSSVLEVPADQTFSGTVARTGQPFIKIYAPQESKACDSNETLKQLGIKTFICMPMMVNGCALGTLSLAHPEVIQLDEYLPQWIASLANYVASLTERKRTETKLLQANERFELAAKAVNSTIYDWDIVKNSVQRTKEVASLLGYGSQEAEPTMDWWLDRIHPDDRQQIQPLVSAALAYEETFAFEYRICNNNNQYLHIWDHGLIIRDADGRAVRVVGSMMDITRRKQIEEALRDSERRLTLVLAGAKAGSWELNLATYQGFWSDENFKLMGYEPGSCEVHYDNWLKVIHPEDRERADRCVKQVIEENAELSLEYRVLLPEDAVRWLRTIGKITYDEQGNQIGMSGIQLDITDRKQAEEALRESEEQYRRIIETASEGIWTLDAENKTIFANQKIAEMLGYRVDEMLGLPLLAFLDQEVETNAQKQLERRRQGIQEQHDFKFRRKDGSDLWAIVSATPILDATGQYVGAFGMITDITERKQAEEALRESEERFRLLAENSTDMISRHTIDEGIYIYASPACQTLLGYAPEELVGHSAYEFFHPDDWVQIRECYATILDLPVTYTVAYRNRCKDGHYIWLETTCRTLRDQETGAILEIHSASRDITERKQVEEILRQQFLREQLITRISRGIHQSLNLEEILNTTVTEVRQFLESDRVIIYRLESNKSGVVVVESVGSGWKTISGTIINDCYFAENYFQLYQQGRIQALEDIYTADLTPCHVDLLARFQVRANLVVPIVQEEQLWGLLVAQQCSGARKWQPLEIDLLQSLATQAAIAIQKSELYAHSQAEIAQRQQAEAALQQQFLKERLIAQSAQRIRQSLNLEDILNTTVAEVQQFLHVDRVLIYRLWSNGTGSAVAEAVVPGWPAVLGQTFPEEVFPQESRELYCQGRILTISDVEQAIGLPCLAEFVQQFGVKAKLVVPILQEETLWGLLIVHQCSSPHHWQPLEIDLMKSLATQLAIAIQQSQLYQQSRAATATALTQAQQIEEALSELQRTQSQLVQSEKMSSLGQLVAGVAHEINNPVTFIYANLVHAENYTQDILGLLNLYQQQYPHPTLEISLEIEALDLDFLIKDLPKLLSSMKVGAERICEIVAALRNFSRLAEAEMKEVDIHEGLDSTLTILQNRLKAQGKHPEIQVIKEYGNLPKIECYAGQLNQVFMNLLSNAIDAIDEQNQMRTVEEITANPSLIRIHTEILNKYQVAIRIVDNGPGITEQVKARIFDPFFTTKPVGAGTGLGLSISYQIIVEKHGGQLECESVLGQGTEFVIQLPLWQRAIAVA